MGRWLVDFDADPSLSGLSEPLAGPRNPAPTRPNRPRPARRRRVAPPALEVDQVLASVAHELSAPLNTMVMAAEALQTARAAVRDPMVDVIVAEVARLRSTVDSLLDRGRVTTVGLRARQERCEVAMMVRRAAVHAGLSPLDGSLAGIDCDAAVSADTGLLERTMTNLLRNALRHGCPPINVWCETDGPATHIHVRDSGPGIADEAIDTLFEPFRPTGRTGRIGLGLWLSRAFAESCGGSLELSDPAGAWLTLTLPTYREPT